MSPPNLKTWSESHGSCVDDQAIMKLFVQEKKKKNKKHPFKM